LILTAVLLINSSCNRDQTLDQIAYKASKNKIYKEIDETEFASVLESTITEETKNLTNPEFINNFYKKNGFQAILLKRYLPDDQLEHLTNYLMEADKHGLSPEVFTADSYRQEFDKVLNRESINT